MIDKTTISITPSHEALAAINGIGDVPVITDKVQLRKAFRDFASNTKYTLKHVFGDDIQYQPITHKNKMEGFILRTPDHSSKVATVWISVAMGLVQYSFKPSEITDEAKVQFDALLQLTLPHGYVTLYRFGMVSMVEYAVDVDDIYLADVVLVDEGRREYKLMDYGTVYCGCRRSKLVGTLYDKGAHRRLTDPTFTRTQLRFEVRRRAPKLTLQQWVETGSAENPFLPFIVVPRAALRTLVGTAKAEKLYNFGLHEVIKNHPARQALIGQLRGIQFPWAEPQLLWSNCREHLLPSLKPCDWACPSNGH
jgi:hypothetical protein